MTKLSKHQIVELVEKIRTVHPDITGVQTRNEHDYVVLILSRKISNDFPTRFHTILTFDELINLANSVDQ